MFRIVLFAILFFIAAWGGFAVGWLANDWRNRERVREAKGSLRYQLATKEEEFQHMRDALDRARAELVHLRAQGATNVDGDGQDPRD